MLITRHSHHHEGVINPEPICIKPDRDLLRNSLTIKSSPDTTVPTGSLYYDYELRASTEDFELRCECTKRRIGMQEKYRIK